MRIFLVLFLSLIYFNGYTQICNLSDSSGCDCKDGSNECDLLPNLKLSYDLLIDPNENFEYPGRYEVSVSTPNVGHGPLRVIATDYFLCGIDTIYNTSGLSSCPDGSTPRQLVKQQIYQKKADGSMESYEVWAGSMTYHQTHGHMHFDDWGVYTLRIEQPGVDPLNWPIIGEGAKLGFCIMDFGSCQYYTGQCRDDNNNILTTDSPNYGLGGGQYSCGLYNQGISAGWTDIYHYYLDGMYIDIPPGTCNGDYKIVVQVDPHNVLIEESDDDNMMIADVTLTQQSGATGSSNITASGSNQICKGETISLSVPQIGTDYLWSNGSTTSTIIASTAGDYSCTITTNCGLSVSNTFSLVVNETLKPVVNSAETCVNQSVTLSIDSPGTGEYNWYTSAAGGSPIYNGINFTTPQLSTTASFFVENKIGTDGAVHSGGAYEFLGTNDYSGDTFNGELFFNVSKSFLLKSVKVYTDIEAIRTVELRNGAGILLQSTTVNIPIGESRITLNFNITPGNNYILTTNANQNISELGYESPRLKRTANSTSYPYEIQGIASVFDSNYGTSYYYYFYDWEMEEPSSFCLSERTEAIVNVSPLQDATFTYPQTVFCIQTAVPVPDYIAASGGLFSANNGLNIDPSTGEIDVSSVVTNTIYTIDYNFNTSCPSSHSVDVSFEVCSSQEEVTNLKDFVLQPNPNSGNFELGFDLQGTYKTEVTIYNLTGELIYQKNHGSISGNFRQQLQLKGLSSGIYLIQVEAGTQFIHKKMIVSK